MVRNQSLAIAAGFTLVELLIVIGIVGALSALVVPVGLKQIESARARQEEAMVRGSLEAWVSDAFISGRAVRITANGRSLIVSFAGDDQAKVDMPLDYLFFHPFRTVEVNENGVANPSTLEFSVAGRNESINLNRWQTQ